MLDDEKTVRAKWTFDGAKSIDEMVEALERKAEYLKELKGEGWKLKQEVKDDYAFLVKEQKKGDS